MQQEALSDGTVKAQRDALDRVAARLDDAASSLEGSAASMARTIGTKEREIEAQATALRSAVDLALESFRTADFEREVATRVLDPAETRLRQTGANSRIRLLAARRAVEQADAHGELEQALNERDREREKPRVSRCNFVLWAEVRITQTVGTRIDGIESHSLCPIRAMPHPDSATTLSFASSAA